MQRMNVAAAPRTATPGLARPLRDSAPAHIHRARAATPGASPAQQAQHEDFLSAALGRLFAVAENYPQLRAAESFVQLQQELTNTEDRIAAGRRFYNANVRRMNTKVEVFPSNIIANMFNFERAEYC